MNRNPGQGARPGATMNPAMYRAPYQQQYSISQPRTGLPYGTLPQQHRAQQVIGAAPQSQGQSQAGAAAYLRQQQSTGFPFSSSVQQQQPSAAASLQAAHLNPLGTVPNGSGVSNAQLVQQMAASNSLASQNDGQLDPNEFPALGPTSHNSGNAPSAAQQPNASQSYASQAQQHSANSAALTSTGFTGQGTNVPRDFTNPDEFPALGGQQPHDNHPPGLNGFSTQSSQTNMPAMMQRTILQPDPEKRLQALKSSAQSGFPQSSAPTYTTNGVSSQPHANAVSIGQNQLSTGFSSTLHPTQQQDQRANSVAGQSTPDPNLLSAQTHGQTHTPAEQVLHSPADRWGLQALVRALRNPNQEASLLADGQDLTTLGLELDNPGSLYRTFATPWADYSASQPLAEPNYHLPACYNVTPPAPSAKRAKQWSDETLFFAFYAMPRDQFQDVAAQELYEREWRYHKELRLWITKGPEQQQPSLEGELFTIWDVEAWERVHRPFKFNFGDLEERRPLEATQQVSASVGLIAPNHMSVGVPQTQPVQSQFAPMHMRA